MENRQVDSTATAPMCYRPMIISPKKVCSSNKSLSATYQGKPTCEVRNDINECDPHESRDLLDKLQNSVLTNVTEYRELIKVVKKHWALSLIYTGRPPSGKSFPGCSSHDAEFVYNLQHFLCECIRCTNPAKRANLVTLVYRWYHSNKQLPGNRIAVVGLPSLNVPAISKSPPHCLSSDILSIRPSSARSIHEQEGTTTKKYINKDDDAEYDEIFGWGVSMKGCANSKNYGGGFGQVSTKISKQVENSSLESKILSLCGANSSSDHNRHDESTDCDDAYTDFRQRERTTIEVSVPPFAVTGSLRSAALMYQQKVDECTPDTALNNVLSLQVQVSEDSDQQNEHRKEKSRVIPVPVVSLIDSDGAGSPVPINLPPALEKLTRAREQRQIEREYLLHTAHEHNFNEKAASRTMSIPPSHSPSPPPPIPRYISEDSPSSRRVSFPVEERSGLSSPSSSSVFMPSPPPITTICTPSSVHEALTRSPSPKVDKVDSAYEADGDGAGISGPVPFSSRLKQKRAKAQQVHVIAETTSAEVFKMTSHPFFSLHGQQRLQHERLTTARALVAAASQAFEMQAQAEMKLRAIAANEKYAARFPNASTIAPLTSTEVERSAASAAASIGSAERTLRRSRSINSAYCKRAPDMAAYNSHRLDKLSDIIPGKSYKAFPANTRAHSAYMSRVKSTSNDRLKATLTRSFSVLKASGYKEASDPSTTLRGPLDEVYCDQKPNYATDNDTENNDLTQNNIVNEFQTTQKPELSLLRSSVARWSPMIRSRIQVTKHSVILMGSDFVRSPNDTSNVNNSEVVPARKLSRRANTAPIRTIRHKEKVPVIHMEVPQKQKKSQEKEAVSGEDSWTYGSYYQQYQQQFNCGGHSSQLSVSRSKSAGKVLLKENKRSNQQTVIDLSQFNLAAEQKKTLPEDVLNKQHESRSLDIAITGSSVLGVNNLDPSKVEVKMTVIEIIRRNHSARVIQRLFHRYKARRSRNVTIIQSLYRGYKGRVVAFLRRRDTKRYNDRDRLRAAITIQAYTRGMFSRHENKGWINEAMKRRVKATVVLQAALRGAILRKQYTQVMVASPSIRMIFCRQNNRLNVASKLARNVRCALIQAFWRGYNVRKTMILLFSVANEFSMNPNTLLNLFRNIQQHLIVKRTRCIVVPRAATAFTYEHVREFRDFIRNWRACDELFKANSGVLNYEFLVPALTDLTKDIKLADHIKSMNIQLCIRDLREEIILVVRKAAAAAVIASAAAGELTAVLEARNTETKITAASDDLVRRQYGVVRSEFATLMVDLRLRMREDIRKEARYVRYGKPTRRKKISTWIRIGVLTKPNAMKRAILLSLPFKATTVTLTNIDQTPESTRIILERSGSAAVDRARERENDLNELLRHKPPPSPFGNAIDGVGRTTSPRLSESPASFVGTSATITASGGTTLWKSRDGPYHVSRCTSSAQDIPGDCDGSLDGW